MDSERRPVDYSYVITQGTFLIGNWGNNLIADTVTSRRLPAAVVVAAAGEIDLATADDLARLVQAAFELHPGTAVPTVGDSYRSARQAG